MDWRIWAKIEQVLSALEIQPILAVVPDNQDPNLIVGPAAKDFWERVRQWQARKWTIALHGYQHRYVNQNGGVLKLPQQSEFAGLSKSEQETKLRAGLAIFAEHGVHTETWVAPCHSFDETTIRLLPQLGIRVISDGFTLLPFDTKTGVTWVPQQLWSFRQRKSGVWTICFHPNLWDRNAFERFCRDAKTFRENINTLPKVVDRWRGRRRDVRDRLNVMLTMARLRWRPRVYRLRALLAKQAHPKPKYQPAGGEYGFGIESPCSAKHDSFETAQTRL
jgi:predicted deacetylase